MYKTFIGLEVHCELKTKSKGFSSSANVFSLEPNTNVSPVDIAQPGIIPSVNDAAVKKALAVALSLNCQIADELKFDRKNYVYPDLAKGYQLTQDEKPMGKEGYFDVYVGERVKRVEIQQIHLEEDTASLEHIGDYSLIDYNRSGMPLIEMVTKPCLHDEDETLAFLESLRNMILYLGVSDARTDRGQMRCDVNISLQKKGETKLGTKVEVKNINSFSSVKDAIRYEIKRQKEILMAGGAVEMETRRFDEDRRKTFTMRKKVKAADYKYFTDPNLPPRKIKDEFVKQIKDSLPKLEFERINIYMEENGLSFYDASVLVRERENADFYEACVKEGIGSKEASNWISGVIMSYLNKHELNIKDLDLSPKILKSLVEMVEKKTISLKQAREVLEEGLDKKENPLELVKKKNMTQLSDEEELLTLIHQIIEENPEVVTNYLNGRDKVFDYLVGQIMKLTRGRANPELTATLMEREVRKEQK